MIANRRLHPQGLVGRPELNGKPLVLAILSVRGAWQILWQLK